MMAAVTEGHTVGAKSILGRRPLSKALLGYGELVISEGGAEWGKIHEGRAGKGGGELDAVVLGNSTCSVSRNREDEATKAGKAMAWWTLLGYYCKGVESH